MERIDVFFKGAVALIGATVSYIVDGIGLAFTVLLGLMLIDVITGFMVGWVTKNVSSSVGTKGLVKKIYIILLIGAIYLVELAGVDIAGYAGDGVVLMFIVIELISIVENGGKLGAPIPQSFKEAISALKGKGEAK